MTDLNDKDPDAVHPAADTVANADDTIAESHPPPPISAPQNLTKQTPWQRFTERGLYPTLVGIGASGIAALGYLVITPEMGPSMKAIPAEALGGFASLLILAVPATMFVIRHRRLNAEFWRINRELELSTTRTRALRRLNNELRDGIEWYRGVINQQEDLILRRDLKGRITHANDAVAKLCGIGAEKLVGSPLKLNIDPRTEQLFDDRLAAVRDAPFRSRHEERVLTPEGWRWIAWQDVAIRADDRVLEIQSNGRDVTDHKLIEAQLTSARNDAQRANRAKSSFLATVSHEIRTPLNGILGMANLLRGTELTAEQHDYTQAIDASGEALMAIINDILDFSKIEAGRLDLERQDFELLPVIERVCQLLAPRAHGKAIEIGAHVATDVPAAVNGDAGRLRQVLLNLAGNAVKFTESGGVRLDVTVVSDEDERIVLLFEVSDSGVGIPIEAQDRLFEEFTQADATPARQYGGTGLGLAISERIVRLMNGQIGVESAPGDGSTFWFVAEFARPAEDEDHAPGEADAGRPLAGERVLLVDGNDVSRGVGTQLLSDAGAEVTAASNRDDATDWLRASAASSRPFTAVLLDATLPDADLSVLARLSRSASPADAPRLLALTRPSDRARLAESEKRVFDGCLVKPLQQSTLLRDGLNGQRLTQEGGDTARSSRAVQVIGEKKRKPLADGVKVLLADDNNINQLLAETLLKRMGAEVLCVGDGNAALEAVRRADFSMVLMDVHMPGMDGLEATRQIRRLNGKRGRVPIIALTASSADDDRQRCLAAGMNDYLIKPLDHEALQQTVQRWSPSSPPIAAIG